MCISTHLGLVSRMDVHLIVNVYIMTWIQYLVIQNTSNYFSISLGLLYLENTHYMDIVYKVKMVKKVIGCHKPEVDKSVWN